MDLTIVDVTDLPEDAVRPGDPVEFFGGAIDLDDFATRSGTIGYALLTSLGPRHQRDYVGSGRSSAVGHEGTNSALGAEQYEIKANKRQ